MNRSHLLIAISYVVAIAVAYLSFPCCQLSDPSAGLVDFVATIVIFGFSLAFEIPVFMTLLEPGTAGYWNYCWAR